MVSFKIGVGALIAAAGLTATPAAALTAKECRAAYTSAKRSGTLGAMSWRAFHKAKCGRQSREESTRGTAAGATPATGRAPGGRGYLPGGRAVFPTAIAPKYSDETRRRGRRQTCLDQYKLNKARNANGGLKWVEEGGGYYIECARRLRNAGRRR